MFFIYGTCVCCSGNQTRSFFHGLSAIHLFLAWLACVCVWLLRSFVVAWWLSLLHRRGLVRMNRGIEGAISKRHHAIFCDLSRFALDFSAFAGTSSALLFSSLLKIFQSLFLVLSFERALLLPFLLYFTLGCGIDNSFTISPLQGTWDTFLRFPLVSPLVVYVVVGCGVTHTHTHTYATTRHFAPNQLLKKETVELKKKKTTWWWRLVAVLWYHLLFSLSQCRLKWRLCCLFMEISFAIPFSLRPCSRSQKLLCS